MNIKTNIRSTTVCMAAVVSAMTLGAIPSEAALNWEGQSGVFMNTLAYTLGDKKTEVAYHYIDLQGAGNVHSASVTYGFTGKAEVGYTRVISDVTGTKDHNIIHGKYQLVPETKNAPAVALWLMHRDLVGSGSGTEYGVVATKILSDIKDHPVIVSLGARSTKALGQGVYGMGNREIRFDGALAIFVTKKLIVGAEFRQQVGSDAWGDVAARYVVNDHLNLDIGLANLGGGFRDQLALGATWAF